MGEEGKEQVSYISFGEHQKLIKMISILPLSWPPADKEINFFFFFETKANEIAKAAS